MTKDRLAAIGCYLIVFVVMPGSFVLAAYLRGW